jgi:uncharacterized protein (TIGR00730 family)
LGRRFTLLSSLCVFCGASSGHDPVYARAADALGRELASRSIELVTGGGRVGLMGVVADAALSAGGNVTGVIPRGLEEREVAHRGLTRLHVVETLHERKALMHELSDAFIALPGGFGTLDELTETVTWAQLGIHAKPIGIVNVGGYFDDLLAFVAVATKRGFVSASHREMLAIGDDVKALLDALVARGAAGAR